MGKSPMAYHGHERSRHHNYSRNSQSRNRRSENQGFAPANYIYPPDRFLRQLPSYRRGTPQRGAGSSRQYFKGRSFHNRPYSSARVRSPLVQKRFSPQREHTRRDMHPPGESESASKSSDQSTDVMRIGKESTSEGQHVEENHSSSAGQASVPQTRSSAKAQQSKSEEIVGVDKGEAEDGTGKSQTSSPQKRSFTKVHSKTDEVTIQEKNENEDSDSKKLRSTRGNSKVRNDDKGSNTVAEVHPTEERITGHNTRSAAKSRLDVSDECEQQDEVGNISKTRKVRKDTRTPVPEMEVVAETTHKQESEGLVLVETEKKTHNLDHEADSLQIEITDNLTTEAAQGTAQNAKEIANSEESGTRNEKDTSTVSSNVKHRAGSKSPRLILSQIEMPVEKHKESSPDKGKNMTATSSDIAEIKDTPRRSSRRGSSRMQIEKEDTQLSYRIQHRDQSRTPVRIQQQADLRERGDTSAASIRSISCRRSIRDSPFVSTINDSCQKHNVSKQHVQVTVKKSTKEYLTGSTLDVSSEKSIDVTTESDESSVSKDNIRKRKATVLETDQEHKKKCTLQSEQNSSIFSAVSSPLQLLTQKQEPVSSSTPLKVMECCETVHMELSEESITDESVAYEKARDNISEQSLTYEKGTHVPDPICEPTYEKGTHVPDPICEPTSRKWCSVM